MEEKSGKVLLLRFIYPCLEDLLKIRKITPDDLNYFKTLVGENREPRVTFLESCLPYVMAKYREFCEKDGYKPDLSYESVLNHLKNHHGHADGHTGDCAFRIAEVVSVIRLTSSLVVLAEGKRFYALNTYKLDLKKGDKVYLHKRVAIDKVE